MKKKIICTLLVAALVLCASVVAFPGVMGEAYAHYDDGTPCTDANCPDYIAEHNPPAKVPEKDKEKNNTQKNNPPKDKGPKNVGPEEDGEEELLSGEGIRWTVWVERGRDENGQSDDKIVMELIPVKEEEKAEYLEKFKAFTGWDDEDVTLYSPADGFFTVQVMARLADFEQEHIYGGKSSIEIGFIDTRYYDPTGAVYYEHKALEESPVDYALILRIGELRIEVPADYTKADFTFAAKPDGNGGWEIILKDTDGSDIDYTVLE